MITIFAPQYKPIGQYYELPLGLAYIASSLKNAGLDVTVINENEEMLIHGSSYQSWLNDVFKRTDVLCTGGLSVHYNLIKNILNNARRINPNIKTILGGGLIGSEPELMVNEYNCNHGIVGEGEIATLELLQGKITDRIVKAPTIEDINILPFPDYDGLKVNNYLGRQLCGDEYYTYPVDNPRVLPIISSRSCPYSCTFCLPEGTKILTEHWQLKNIENINLNENIIGINDKGKYVLTNVTYVFPKREVDELYYIETEKGAIVSTGEHPWLSDHDRWREAKNFEVGQDLRFVAESKIENFNTDGIDFKKGYVCGAWMGDGTNYYFKKTNGKTIKSTGLKSDKLYDGFCVRLVGDYDMLDTAIDRANSIGFNFRKYIFKPSKVFYGCNRGIIANRRHEYNLMNKLFEMCKTIEPSREFVAGWLSGFFDAEGSWAKQGQLRFSNNKEELKILTKNYLSILGFNSKIEEKGVIVIGGLSENVRLISTIKPTVKSKLRGQLNATLSCNTKINNIKKVTGKFTVYNLETSTHNFVADGFITHNCYHPIGPKYRTRSMDNFGAEVEQLKSKYNVNILAILDELISDDNERLSQLCSTLKRFNIKWMTQTRVSNVTKNMMKMMKDSGCFNLSIGIEHLDDRILTSMKKHTTRKEIENALSIASEIGIGIQGNILLGTPEETPETLNNALSWWKNNLKYGINLTNVIPYPGSKLYKDYVASNIIPNKLEYIKKGCPCVSKFNDGGAIQQHLNQYNHLPAELISKNKTRIDKYRGQLWNVTVKCCHCKQVSNYIDLYMGATGSNFMQGKAYRIGCKHCNQRMDFIL